MRWGLYAIVCCVSACGARAQLDRPVDDGGALPGCDAPLAARACRKLSVRVAPTQVVASAAFPAGLVARSGHFELIAATSGSALDTVFSVVRLDIDGSTVFPGAFVTLFDAAIPWWRCSVAASSDELAVACVEDDHVRVRIYDANDMLVADVTLSSVVSGRPSIVSHGDQWLVSWEESIDEPRYAVLDRGGNVLVSPTKLFDHGGPAIGATHCGWVTAAQSSTPGVANDTAVVRFDSFTPRESLPFTIANDLEIWPGTLAIAPWPFDPRAAAVFTWDLQPGDSSSLVELTDRGTSTTLDLEPIPDGFGDYGTAVTATSWGLLVARRFNDGSASFPPGRTRIDATVLDANGHPSASLGLSRDDAYEDLLSVAVSNDVAMIATNETNDDAIVVTALSCDE